MRSVRPIAAGADGDLDHEPVLVGQAARIRSYSSGVNVRVRLPTTLGSSVSSHGLKVMTRSRTARLKIEWSIVWYLRMLLGDRPPARRW